MAFQNCFKGVPRGFSGVLRFVKELQGRSKGLKEFSRGPPGGLRIVLGMGFQEEAGWFQDIQRVSEAFMRVSEAFHGYQGCS